MQIGETELLEVWDLGLDALYVVCEQINVADAAQHLIRLKPKRILFPSLIQSAQIIRAREPRTRKADEQVFQVKEKIIARAI